MPQPTVAAPAASATRVLRPTLETAGQWRAAIRRWPELDALVCGLQAQNLFPGLRGMRITLTGSEDWCAKGLDAIGAQNAPAAPKPAPAGQE